MRWWREVAGMTGQEIRCAILKYVYEEKKAGKDYAMAVLSRISSDYKVDSEKVQTILRYLRNEGLLRDSTRGGVVYTTDKQITEKGIREYQEKCTRSKGY